jgi:hypothetical protein
MPEYVCICMYICVSVCKCYGNLRVQSTVLDGLQGCFGGPWGVLWGSWGSWEVRGRPGKGWGGSGEVPGGSRGGLEKRDFLFF